jgi:hypothetical protein
MPALEVQRRRQPEVRAECCSHLVQRLAVGGLIGREVEASGRFAQRPEEERLALATSAGDDSEGGSGPLVAHKSSELRPFDVAVEHVVRLTQYVN